MKLYCELTKQDGCVSVIAGPDREVVFTGTRVHWEPEKYRHLAAPFEENDFHFWFGNSEPEAPVYTVPRTVLCGYDSRGGYFAALGELSFREPEPLYYISPEGKCFLITSDARAFREPFPGWREGMVPGGDIEVFLSREEAARKYEIRNLQELLGEKL